MWGEPKWKTSLEFRNTSIAGQQRIWNSAVRHCGTFQRSFGYGIQFESCPSFPSESSLRHARAPAKICTGCEVFRFEGARASVLQEGARRCIFDTSKKARGCSWSGFELKWIASTNRICSKGDKVKGLSLNSFNYKTRMCLQSYHGQTRTLNAKSTRWCSDIKTSWSILIRHPGNSSLCLWLCPSCEPSCKSL